uniref:GB1/RHD3-type G domain-containing protein n=1 Tax=Globodera pallida TaxID=36090 RepID=A0A183CDV9_GLOPA
MTSHEQWVSDMKRQAEIRKRNIQVLKNAKPLDKDRLRSMDSSLKKVATFTQKLKNIDAQSAPQFLPELDRLNLPKYLHEIAANICEAKLTSLDLERVSGTIGCTIPSAVAQQKELLLHGLFEKDGLQLLGAVLSYLVNIDKQEHVNVIVPLSIVQRQSTSAIDAAEGLSSMFSDEQRNVVAKLLTDYWDGLVEHTNNTRLAMNKLLKQIKRRRASADDRQRFETLEAQFRRLSEDAVDLGECLGRAPPIMPSEPSDDELERFYTGQSPSSAEKQSQIERLKRKVRVLESKNAELVSSQPRLEKAEDKGWTLEMVKLDTERLLAKAQCERWRNDFNGMSRKYNKFEKDTIEQLGKRDEQIEQLQRRGMEMEEELKTLREEQKSGVVFLLALFLLSTASYSSAGCK